MKSILVTAFEPYDCWTTNASWLALVELTRELPSELAITTRRYPVDFAALRGRLESDLRGNYDFALHLGQAPGSTHIQLETFGVNQCGCEGTTRSLVDAGPAAYRSPLPVDRWALMLGAIGIPAQVSYHAGTYLCNAALYLSCHLAEEMSLKTQSAFVHLPLDLSQTAASMFGMASLPAATSAAAIRAILHDLAQQG